MKLHFSLAKLVFIIISVLVFLHIIINMNTYIGIKREYRSFEVKKKELKTIKDSIKKEILEKEEHVHKMNEPAIIIKASKEKMGYLEPGEVVFRFE